MVNSLECGGPAPLWPARAWRGFIEKHSTMTPDRSDQSAARPAHSKELSYRLDQIFLQSVFVTNRVVVAKSQTKLCATGFC